MKKLGYFALGSFCIGIILVIAGGMMEGFGDLEAMYERSNIHIPKALSTIGTIDHVEKEFHDTKNMEINIDCGQLEIVEYEGTTIKVEADKVGSNTIIEQKGNTLVLEEKDSIFSISLFNRLYGQMKIYVPQNYQFQSVELEVDTGEIIVSNLVAEYVDINADVGDFSAQNIKAGQLVADVDAGNVEIGLLDCYDSEFDCDVGNIDVTVVGSESDYSYETECDVGDITIGSYQVGGFDSEYHKTGGSRRIKADCDAGNIEIKMEG